ncbi:hypothetical protein DPMN_047998 [Dreissena polymorpha]|uniref:Uncharacterized protein n=1 Tax=Dreissena polymorpha TaxID=45954 RepID=A0A9D4DBG0_DREPO|nr:hypothetical protein DPMN_047998 [Dreissena polymorpha]
MRKRKEMKAAGHRLFHYVTALNSALMNILSLHPSIETTWFFNVSVFALTKNQQRIIFYIYDDINNVFSDHRTNRRKKTTIDIHDTVEITGLHVFINSKKVNFNIKLAAISHSIYLDVK